MGTRFCVASRKFHLDRQWRLIVFAHGHTQGSLACVIPAQVPRQGASPDPQVAGDDDQNLLARPAEGAK